MIDQYAPEAGVFARLIHVLLAVDLPALDGVEGLVLVGQIQFPG